ncbi:ABC transporter ATP-binding protein [Actinomyces ruminicola]|uniref:Fluoroquinolone transport system ATP-binding protein n=1 Tax=Actinomyces ruminicola TaxID=332524 RepID=A0A1G9WGK3_9ACTO|nr:ABC transporter ATP-binding protein [Actinomyces ruminicola]SDM83610.1 fluoroquinolone transport system ATP-binding protein [Actinomyces ruminicola]
MVEAIATRSLGFSYRGAAAPTLHGIDLTVGVGEVIGLLGPSGAGKSTLQRVLTGQLRGATGDARVLGRELSLWGRELYERVGVGFEHPVAVGCLTLRENLAYFARMYPADTREPDELLELLGLAEDAGLRASAMSKGMGIRLNVARALLHRPELLFLDEPSSGLDPVAASRMVDLITRERERGCTVVVTTHDMVLAQEVCDRVGFVVDGTIVETGAPAELRRRHGRREVVLTWDGGRSVFPLDGLADDPGFHRDLRERRVHTLHSQEADLAQVFRAVTGRELS